VCFHVVEIALRQVPHTHGLKIATFSPGQRNLEIILQQKLPEEHAHSRPQPNTNPEDFGTLWLQIELETLKENYGKPSSALCDPKLGLGCHTEV